MAWLAPVDDACMAPPRRAQRHADPRAAEDCGLRGADGAQIAVADFDHSNWADFTVTPAPGFDRNLVRAVAGGVVSAVRELYNNVVD